MKTCLYQPIFINPQAYFVFPSLYHIEKGDSFIEPANITGQLIINTLTDDPTLTPIILTVKDNNQVDFSIFAGKHIRISQYTDEGAVVLGEWLMPGEPAPVYPDWFNDSIVCWYSPSKQKLTQLDVIESYAEDFTYWTINNTSITSTQKKIVIPAGTELKYVIAYRGFNSSTDGFHIKYTGNAVITYRYNKEDDTTGSITINESGIYHLPASVRTQKNFGFYCNTQTTTEEATIEILPTSILKDFSGNGLDAYMYGFQGKLNSGVGIYSVDFTTYNNSGNQNVTDIKPNSFVLLAGALSRLGLPYSSIIGEYIPSYAIRIQGISGGTITYYYRNENGKQLTYVMDADGDYILPPCYSEGTEGTAVNIVANNNRENVTITQIPDYPNQLCYSGKEYCISYNQPILTDYTVIADRTWFAKDSVRTFSSKYKDTTVKPGLFKFEWAVNNSEYTSSLGKDISVTFSDGITWQTKTSYNGKALTNLQYEDGEHLIIGDYAEKIGNYYIGCHSDFLLFNRTLNEDEINWLKENIYNIEI